MHQTPHHLKLWGSYARAVKSVLLASDPLESLIVGRHCSQNKVKHDYLGTEYRLPCVPLKASPSKRQPNWVSTVSFMFVRSIFTIFQAGWHLIMFTNNVRKTAVVRNC